MSAIRLSDRPAPVSSAAHYWIDDTTPITVQPAYGSATELAVRHGETGRSMTTTYTREAATRLRDQLNEALK